MATDTRTEFKIDKNRPMPKTQRPARQGGRPKFPFKVMNVGDSFFIAKGREGGGSLVRYWNMNLRPRVFTLRTVTEKDVRGVRIWRIK